MKKTIRILSLLIVVLCISISSLFAGDASSSNPVNGDTKKDASGTFIANILRPLSVFWVAPQEMIAGDENNEFVRGAAYDLTIPETGKYPICQYMIHGQLGKDIYITATTATVSSTLQYNESGEYNCMKTDDGVDLYMFWVIRNGKDTPWDGSGNTAHTPKKIKKDGVDIGELIIAIYYKRLDIKSNAGLGDHEFVQTIQVSYNHF